MTLAEFRSNENLIAQAAALKENEIFKLLMSVLDTEHPGRKTVPDAWSAERRGIYQGETEGFQKAISMITLCSKKPAAQYKHLESNYGVKKPEENQQKKE